MVETSGPLLGFVLLAASKSGARTRKAACRAVRMCSEHPEGGKGVVTRQTAGFLVVNKPLQWTSFDVVNKVRGTLERRLRAGETKEEESNGTDDMGKKKQRQKRGRKPLLKCGHGGTLDPAASGILILGVGGNATRAMKDFLAGGKSYAAIAKFGHETDTLDSDGTQVGEDKPFRHISREALEEVIAKKFTGTIMQIPPAYSAIRVGGKRAYDMARSGEDVELEARPVEISSISVGSAGWWGNTAGGNIGENELELRVECGGGTYIRSLVRDIARELGSAAYMSALVRTSQGPAILDDTPALEEKDLSDADAILANMVAYRSAFTAATTVTPQNGAD